MNSLRRILQSFPLATPATDLTSPAHSTDASAYTQPKICQLRLLFRVPTRDDP